MRFGVCVVTTPANKRPLLVGLLVGGIACGWHLNLCLLGRQVKVVKLELTCRRSALNTTTLALSFAVDQNQRDKTCPSRTYLISSIIIILL